jgi:hypothetical protein
VQTFTGSTMVADYRLAYEQSPVTARSRLTSVTLCTGAGACLPATTFSWQNGTTTPTVVSNPGGQNGTLSAHRPYLGDFNGDGLTDILWDKGGSTSTPTSTGTRVLWTGTAAGSFTVTANFAGQDGTLLGYAPALADFNRDGRSDVLWYAIDSNGSATGPTTKWISTNSGTLTVGPGPTVQLGMKLPFQFWFRGLSGLADFNGDARSDLLWSSTKPDVVTVHIASADGNFSTTTLDGCAVFGDPDWDGCGLSGSTVDLNADGLTDLAWVTTLSVSGKGVGLMRSKGDGTFVTLPGVGDTSLHDFTPYFIDINGDGSIDIVWDKIDSKQRSLGERRLWLGKGDGTFIWQSNLAGQDGTLVGYQPAFGDFNGDGLPDILWVQTDTNGLATGARVLWLGKGDGAFTVITNFAGQDGTLVGYVPVIGDFNGDGKADIFWDSRTGTDTRSTGTRVLWLSGGAAPDLVTTVTTGIGASTAVTYKPLTDSTVYTKQSSAIDPEIDLQGPMAAVSRVDTSNGIGGTVSAGYAYAGAVAHLDGRGFLGFQQTKVKDLQTNIERITSYHQTFPFIGLVETESAKLGTQTLNQTTHFYQFLDATGGTTVGPASAPYRVSLTESMATSADLDGSPLPALTSTYQYDAHGNATQIVVSSADGFSKTTTNTYTNDTTKWLLGRLTRAAVTSLVPQPGAPPPKFPVAVAITSSTNNLNLWNYLVANGHATAGTPGSWIVSIASNVTIGSSSTSSPALDIGAFPSGSSLQLINYGTIVGAGGDGGRGGGGNNFCTGIIPPTPGAPGGAALRTLVPVSITNFGRIWAGGGGGGGGDVKWITQAKCSAPASGGGGGGGRFPGPGGLAGGAKAYPGSPGTIVFGGLGGPPAQCSALSSVYLGARGGPGGNPGQSGNPGETGCGPGAPGGPPGPAVIGNSLVTWAAVGDRRGPLN